MITGVQMIGPDSVLRLNAWASVANVIVTCSGRILDDSGSVRPFVFTVAPGSARALKTLDFPVQYGQLLTLKAWASGGTPLYGQCYAQVELVQGTAGTTTAHGLLLGGYVTAGAALGFPGSPIRGPLEGPGVLRSVLGTDPAAGVEIAETVPTGARWRLRAFALSLVASAAVANRVPVLTIDDGATTLFETASAVAVTASQTVKYRAAIGLPFFTLGALDYQLPLPADLTLPAGARVRTITGAIDAGDNYGPPQYLVEEWLDI